MSSYRIAVIPGDGVGNEVASEAGKILRAVAEKHGFRAETENFDWTRSGKPCSIHNSSF